MSHYTVVRRNALRGFYRQVKVYVHGRLLFFLFGLMMYSITVMPQRIPIFFLFVFIRGTLMHASVGPAEGKAAALTTIAVQESAKAVASWLGRLEGGVAVIEAG